ncbi:MAG: hypothetical protein QOE76_1251, partial [Frankiales bacterium]|nr:hypothetical protein [Frankiales bacterium]
TLHAVLVLPVLAWWLARAGRRDADSVRVERLGVAGYVTAAALTLIVSLVALAIH